MPANPRRRVLRRVRDLRRWGVQKRRRHRCDTVPYISSASKSLPNADKPALLHIPATATCEFAALMADLEALEADTPDLSAYQAAITDERLLNCR